MFAVIRSGGKQYRVAKDDRVVVDRIAGDPGTMIALSDVLLLGGDGKAPTVGQPAVAKAAVFAEVLEHSRADKVIVFKKKRRHNYRRKAGHRQHQTVLRIVDVSPTGAAPKFTPTPKRAPKAEGKTKASPTKEPAVPAAEETRPAAKAEDRAPKKVPTKAKKAPTKKQAKAPAKKKPEGKSKATTKKKSAQAPKKGKGKS